MLEINVMYTISNEIKLLSYWITTSICEKLSANLESQLIKPLK